MSQFPPNLEKESRKNRFPEICFPCKNVQCPYRRQENYGKPCKMQFSQYENTKMKPNSQDNPNEQLLRNLEIGIEETIEKAMKPFEKRLQAMENAEPRKPINRSLNGSEIPFNHSRGTNQERIHYSD